MMAQKCCSSSGPCGQAVLQDNRAQAFAYLDSKHAEVGDGEAARLRHASPRVRHSTAHAQQHQHRPLGAGRTVRSAGLSLLSRALPASSLMFEEIPCSPSLSTFGTNGVNSPDSVWTATLMSTLSYCRMKLSIHEALSSGTSRSASAEAFMTKSLTEILYSSPPAALICARVLRRTQQSASEYQRPRGRNSHRICGT